ncbi:MAG: TraR/DksA family transcriptional regulator [Bacteroidales bacterium]|nr:TraR/DksA family transcriptional regulator [Bacteroidales bacterium]
MEENKRVRYSDEELAEFKALIEKKLKEAREGLEVYLEACENAGNDTMDTSPTFKNLEEGSQVLAKEENAQQAARLYKYIQNLESALLRIQNKTYGICQRTGKLIPKERLLSVPHATMCIEAKLESKKK